MGSLGTTRQLIPRSSSSRWLLSPSWTSLTCRSTSRSSVPMQGLSSRLRFVSILLLLPNYRIFTCLEGRVTTDPESLCFSSAGWFRQELCRLGFQWERLQPDVRSGGMEREDENPLLSSSSKLFSGKLQCFPAGL